MKQNSFTFYYKFHRWKTYCQMKSRPLDIFSTTGERASRKRGTYRFFIVIARFMTQMDFTWAESSKSFITGNHKNWLKWQMVVQTHSAGASTDRNGFNSGKFLTRKFHCPGSEKTLVKSFRLSPFSFVFLNFCLFPDVSQRDLIQRNCSIHLVYLHTHQ